MKKLATVYWEGNSLEILRGFPEAVKEDLGHNLYLLQRGEGDGPKDSRPMKSVDRGVFELRDRDERGWYRIIYYAKIKSAIYVLHIFKKSSRKTEIGDLDLARKRLKDLKRRLKLKS